MKVTETNFEGLVVITPSIFEDARGLFVKTYQKWMFEELGLPFEPREEFFSISHKGVLRGMHFQLPPEAHHKVVYPVTGSALDVVVDLRKASPTFGQHFARQLDSLNREMLFIPAGFAHGFLALANETLMVYLTSTVHSPAHDAGIRWDSFGFSWPVAGPILSNRDRGFPTFQEFHSPF